MSILTNIVSGITNISRRQKIILIIGVTSGLFAWLSFTSYDFSLYIGQMLGLPNYDPLRNGHWAPITDTMIPLVSALTAIASLAFYYLQFGGISSIDAKSYDSEYSELKSSFKRTELEVNELRDLLNELDGVDKEAREKLIRSTLDSIQEDTIGQHIDKKIESLKIEYGNIVRFKQLENHIKSNSTRIQNEIVKLGLRSNINLILGMAITILGLVLLWDTVGLLNNPDLVQKALTSGSEGNETFYKSMALNFIPRITLVIFIEIFAYFFLRLYKDSLSDMKYFQNELTNLESKNIALLASINHENNVGLEQILIELSKTERNHVLDKGQTTVELEKAKTDTDLVKSISTAIPVMIKGFKANK